MRTWVHRASLNTCISLDRKKRRRKAAELEIDSSLLSPETETGRQAHMLREL